MAYFDATSRSLAAELDQVPVNDIDVVVSFDEMTFVDEKVKYFDKHKQVAALTDDSLTTILDAPDDDDKTRKLIGLSVCNPGPYAIEITFFYVDDADSYVLKRFLLEPDDNLEFTDKDGWRLVNGTGFLKVTPPSDVLTLEEVTTWIIALGW